VPRKEHRLVFASSRSLTRAQVIWLDEHVGKLFATYCIKDELEVKLEALQEEASENRKAAPHE